LSLAVVAVALLTPPLAFARPACVGSGESRVCCKPDGNTMETRVCASQDLAVADRELNKTYKAVMHALTPDARAALRIEQRAWLNRLEPDCIADVGDPATSGTIWPQEFTDCKAQETRKRTQALRARSAMRQ